MSRIKKRSRWQSIQISTYMWTHWGARGWLTGFHLVGKLWYRSCHCGMSDILFCLLAISTSCLQMISNALIFMNSFCLTYFIKSSGNFQGPFSGMGSRLYLCKEHVSKGTWNIGQYRSKVSLTWPEAFCKGNCTFWQVCNRNGIRSQKLAGDPKLIYWHMD